MPRVKQEQIDTLQEQIDALKAQQAEEEAGGVEPSEEVIAAGAALSKAISEQIGIDMPVKAGEAGGCGLIELPPEFLENGGVGVFAIVVPPPE